MIVLHLGIYEGTLLLWGEQNIADTKSFETKRKSADSLGKNATKDAKTPMPPAHPFACNHAILNRVLAEHNVFTAVDEGRMISKIYAVLSLPSVNLKPLHSTDSSAMGVDLKKYAVPAIAIAPSASIELLACFGNKRMLAPGIVLAPEVTVVLELVRRAARVVVNQQFLPSISLNGDGYTAQWKPVFKAADRTFFSDVTSKTPGVLSAVCAVSQSSGEHMQINTLAAVQDFVTQIVDYLVRNASMEKRTLLKPSSRVKQKKAPAFASVHEAWLAALTNISSKYIEYNQDECAKLQAQLDDWQRPVSVLHSSPFRLCFRLDEPEEELPIWSTRKRKPEEDYWRVSYHLQSQNDKSLMVPAEKVWHSNKASEAIFEKEHFNAREYLLLSLGQAAKLYSQVEDSLRVAAPSLQILNADTAYDFLKEKSVLLEQAGFGVLLPSWWVAGQPKNRLKLKGKARSPRFKSKGNFSAESIVQFDYVAALGDREITFEELTEIASLKTPLVKVRGKWVHIDAAQVEHAVKVWNKKVGSATLSEIIAITTGAKDYLEGEEIDEIFSDGWPATFFKHLLDPSTLTALEPPAGLNATLRPYQIRGYSWLTFLKDTGLGACLADDMGLGKTIQTLAMILNDRQTKKSGPKKAKKQKPVLLVCPTSVVNNWLREANKFTPSLKMMVHHGSGRAKDIEFLKRAQQADIVITSYTLLYRDIVHLLKIEWDGVVLDEAQYIKNSVTKQALAARSLKSEYRLALTGTPVENNVGDLWSLMEFLNPGLLGSYSSFRQTFFRPIQVLGDVEAQMRLKRITQPFILRRLKTDKSVIQDLPDKVESKVYCQLTKEQTSLYQAVLDDFDEKMKGIQEDIERQGLVLVTLMRLKQVCNHPTQFLADKSPVPGRSGKMARLTEIMEEILQSGEKVLIFSQFTKMGDLLKSYLEDQFGYPVLFLHGGVAKKDRDALVERFQTDAGAPIFILSIKAGGTGLNLTAANHVIHFDRWWNPAVENQATDRAFRIGQKKNVQVHKFVCSGTLEEKIDDMIESKQQIASDVVGSGEAWLTKLSNAELKNVFALSKEMSLE